MADRGDKGKREGNSESVDGDRELIDYAINQGVDALIRNNPALKQRRGYLLKHIDRKKIKASIGAMEEQIRYQGVSMSEEDKRRLIGKNIFDYVASGQALDSRARNTVSTRKNLEGIASDGEKPLKLDRKTVKDREYVANAAQAFQGLYNIMRKGGYDSSPEVGKAVERGYQGVAMAHTADVLVKTGTINRKEYSQITHGIRQTMEESLREVKSYISRNYAHKKVVSAFIGLAGAFVVLASGSTITGNAIGLGMVNIPGILIGLIVFILGTYFFFEK